MRTLKTFGSVLFIGLASVNCGGAPDPAALPPQAGCVPGQYGCALPMPGPTTPEQFRIDCGNSGKGYPTPLQGGGYICSTPMTSISKQGPYKLNPSNLSGPQAATLSIFAISGDTVLITNPQACWNSSGFLGYTGNSCSDVDENGIEEGVARPIHDGQAQGLIFSNGQQQIQPGTPIQVSSNGNIKMGVNASGTVNTAVAWATFQVARCINAQGNLYTCPAN